MGRWRKSGWRYGLVLLTVLLALTSCTAARYAVRSAAPTQTPRTIELIEFYSPM